MEISIQNSYFFSIIELPIYRKRVRGMFHYAHLSEEEKERVFFKEPNAFFKDTEKEKLSYALGATLYIPAIHEKLYDYLVTRKYISLTTLVICLEDGIADSQVEEAEMRLKETFIGLGQALKNGIVKEEDLPLLFIRIRSTQQLKRLLSEEEIVKHITGINLPKFNSIEGEEQLSLIKKAGDAAGIKLYAMPIIETKQVIDLQTGQEELQTIKNLAVKYRENVLNIRIGATDFTGLFGIRRSIDATIYDVAVIRDCMARIINYFGQAEDGFVISGPVWEFFSNHSRLLKPELRQTPFRKYGEEGSIARRAIVNKAEDGLIKEVVLDKVNGLVGKTIIHPSHIRLVNALQVVTKEEYEDAMQIIGNQGSGVIKSKGGNKMNEMKPHTNWARKVLAKAEIYGVINENEDYTALF